VKCFSPCPLSNVNRDETLDFKLLLLGTSVFCLVSEQEKVDRMVPIKENQNLLRLCVGFAL